MRIKFTWLPMSITVLVMGCLLWACAKTEQHSAEPVAELLRERPRIRSCSRVFYSKELEPGFAYQLTFSWNQQGLVTIKRSRISSGYQATTSSDVLFDPEVDLMPCGLGNYQDSTCVDSLVLPLQNIGKKYFAVPAQPGAAVIFLNEPRQNEKARSWTLTCSCRANNSCLIKPEITKGKLLRTEMKCAGPIIRYYATGTENSNAYKDLFKHGGGIIVTASAYDLIDENN